MKKTYSTLSYCSKEQLIKMALELQNNSEVIKGKCSGYAWRGQRYGCTKFANPYTKEDDCCSRIEMI